VRFHRREGRRGLARAARRQECRGKAELRAHVAGRGGHGALEGDPRRLWPPSLQQRAAERVPARRIVRKGFQPRQQEVCLRLPVAEQQSAEQEQRRGPDGGRA